MAVPEKKTLFSELLVKDLMSKVRGKSTLAKLTAQTPVPFNGMREFVFSMDKEIDIVAENGQKTEGGITVAPVSIVPIKFEYGARVSDEFMYATEEEQVNVLEAFNDGFAKKVAKGLDLAAFHGINPRTGTASNIVGNNCFDKAVTSTVTYTAAKADENLEDAIKTVHTAEGEVTGMALSTQFGADMAKIAVNGVKQYPEFRFGASPDTFGNVNCDVNNTVYNATVKDHGIVGDFESAFKWGYAKEVPLDIIEYGDPDNSGKDLKGHNQVYIRAEIYLGWGILVPAFFSRIVEA